jgi:hypothetical protein
LEREKTNRVGRIVSRNKRRNNYSPGKKRIQGTGAHVWEQGAVPREGFGAGEERVKYHVPILAHKFWFERGKTSLQVNAAGGAGNCT